ncbi:MAG: hypothetical protein AAFX94_12270, partial [Myxococcota bacterium]
MQRVCSILAVLGVLACGSADDGDDSPAGPVGSSSMTPGGDENSNSNSGSGTDTNSNSSGSNDNDNSSSNSNSNNSNSNSNENGSDPEPEACDPVGASRLGECNRDNDSPPQSQDIVVTTSPQLCAPDQSGNNVWMPLQDCEWECLTGFVEVDNECLAEDEVEDPCDGVDDTLDLNDNGVADCEENLLLNGQFTTDLANWGGLVEDGNTREWRSADAQGNTSSGSAFISDETDTPADDLFQTDVSQCINISGAGAAFTLYAQLNWQDDGGDPDEPVRLVMRANAHVGQNCTNVLVNRPFNRQETGDFLFRIPRNQWHAVEAPLV